MRILVTGGAGYVGSTLVPALLDQGHRVRVLDSLKFGGHGLLPCCQNRFFELQKGDVCNPQDVEKALDGVDAVIHLAAIVGYPACKKEPQLAQAVNVDATRLLLEKRKTDQKFLFASTGSIYGSIPDYVCNENTPRAPITLYGETKAKAEQMVLDAGNGIAYRFATAFGVSNRMRLDLMPNDFTYQAVKNRNLIVYEGGFKRTFVHVRDMARSFIFALERWDEVKDDVYNVGHESMNFTKEDVARKILEHVDYYLHFAEVGSDADQRNYEVSYEKIRAKGFETTIDLDRGIAELVQAARLIEWSNPFSNV
ncbi:NAD-dependent epimerase/dehydratase family protein [Tautonia sociabilis]|uniref:SDR family NAD-dependent epimerase/dehydratase n=1 Tax=Tautonia sociabilis TaxID=2080755 RepID=A0A432MM26_9BACT|nr:NAD-dependent epimerase/dehydratase [Tautonia sociabilis]RUL88462.1 SDR family NAD-dependent epimerase/dehydratase [Tautonia sociabilis]